MALLQAVLSQHAAELGSGYTPTILSFSLKASLASDVIRFS